LPVYFLLAICTNWWWPWNVFFMLTSHLMVNICFKSFWIYLFTLDERNMCIQVVIIIIVWQVYLQTIELNPTKFLFFIFFLIVLVVNLVKLGWFNEWIYNPGLINFALFCFLFKTKLFNFFPKQDILDKDFFLKKQ